MPTVGPRQRSSWVALTVTLVAVALSSAAVAVRISGPSSATTILGFAPDGVGVARLEGGSTRLREGDVVTAIEGRSTLAWAQGLLHRGAAVPRFAVGDTVRFDVKRAGSPVALDAVLVPYPTLDILAASWGTLAFVVVFFIVAGFVFLRRPADPAAGALLVTAVGSVGSTLPFLLGFDVLDLVTGSFTVSWPTTVFVYLLLWTGIIDFALVFPRPFPMVERRPWLRLVPYVVIFGTYVAALMVAALAARDALAWLSTWTPIQLVVIGVVFAALPVLAAVRWRRGPAEDRRILRGFVYVGGFMIVAGATVWLLPLAVAGRPLVPQTMAGLIGLPLPLLIAAAILRQNAFDIDVVVRRSLVYGGLTAAVMAAYVLAAAVLGALMGGLSPFATTLLATGAAAIVALPLRDALQRAVTASLYGDRDEPVRAIRRLGARLESSVDPETMPQVVVDAVADALRLPYVGLELGVGPSARLVAERGARPRKPIARPLVFRSDHIGRLVVDARGPVDPLSSADLRLLDDLTRQIGIAAHAAFLTNDLRASRERIVAAREEERRRLRRDLHDGFGPALAAIGLRAEAAAILVRADPAAAAERLAELRNDIATAVAEVRRLVDGLRPPAIDELGLVGALRLAAARLGAAGSPDLSIDTDGAVADLPAAVEVAVYRIAIEGMTNAIRHAGAANCAIRLVRGNDLSIIVEDDGRGLPIERRDGVGIASMRERAAELGGDCVVRPLPGGGTQVLARLPLAVDGAETGP